MLNISMRGSALTDHTETWDANERAPRFEENLERDRAVATPVAPESRLLRTVRGPGTPTVDAALVGVIARRVARCRLLPVRL